MSVSSLFNCMVMEGPDGGGKTTLIKELKHFTPGVKPHHSGGYVESLGDLIKRVKDCHQVMCRHLGGGYVPIFDRITLISELVYGPILRDRHLISTELANLLLQKFQPLVVYVRPSREIIMSRLKSQTTKPHKDEKHIAKIIEHSDEITTAYDELFFEHLRGYPILKYTEHTEIGELGSLVQCVG